MNSKGASSTMNSISVAYTCSNPGWLAITNTAGPDCTVAVLMTFMFSVPVSVASFSFIGLMWYTVLVGPLMRFVVSITLTLKSFSMVPAVMYQPALAVQPSAPFSTSSKKPSSGISMSSMYQPRQRLYGSVQYVKYNSMLLPAKADRSISSW